MVCAMAFTRANSQAQAQDATYRKFFVGSTLWELGNFIPGDTNPPDLVQLGYHFQFFKNRFFLEPSVAMTHWPINTNVPESFERVESKWSNYFLFEPGLHFGFKF